MNICVVRLTEEEVQVILKASMDMNFPGRYAKAVASIQAKMSKAMEGPKIAEVQDDEAS